MIQVQKPNDKVNGKDTNNKIAQNELDIVAASKIQESEELPSVEQESSHNHPQSVHEATEMQHSISVDIPLVDIEHEIDCDVLVCGNKKYAREEAIKLVMAAGMRGWHAGPIDNSAAAEAMTSLLLFINKHYGIDGAGIRISGKKS